MKLKKVVLQFSEVWNDLLYICFPLGVSNVYLLTPGSLPYNSPSTVVWQFSDLYFANILEEILLVIQSLSVST